MGQEDRAVSFDYTNWKGETGRRRVLPINLVFITGSQWHPEPQWVLRAMDLDKGVYRDFAVKDITHWTPDSTPPTR